MNETAHVTMVDDKIILASAVSYYVGRDLDKYTSAIKSELQEVFGIHITDYRNEAVNEDNSSSYICTILAGLNAPTTRIDRIIARKEDIDRQMSERQCATTKLNNDDSSAKYRLSVKKFGSTTPTTTTDKDLNDLASKFMK